MNPSSNIRFYERAHIDTDRWDSFIKNSPQYRLYALSSWLDHLSPGWGALINSDHSVVMPLTIKRKYGITYLAQPRFTQQLGLYSNAPLLPVVTAAFLNYAQQLFPFAEIFLNVSTGSATPGLRNYILPLGPAYADIRAQYSHSLINNSLKPAAKNQLVYDTHTDIRMAVETYRRLYQQRMGVATAAFCKLEALAVDLEKKGACFTRRVTTAGGTLAAVSLFFIDGQRIYNLCSATPPVGRRTHANYHLYDTLIREFAGSDLILDFEGSNIPGIAAFYKKFGAVPEPYYFAKWNHLKWPYKIFKK
ncbi:hypothetical protein [Niabella hirudinis]|uniref:hypothetical protein n=1 Tax=Niabella hirudinis TaxID=1285929 RepID=UPI003EBB8E30